MLRIDPFAYVFAAALLLTLPLDWCLSALAAGIIHELCHVTALWMLGGTVRTVKISPGGAVIDAQVDGTVRSLICILAGPAGSMMLLIFCHTFPKLALCAAVQGFFNLLPVLPLDGGRGMACILEMLHVSKPERVMCWLEWGTEILLLLLAFMCTYWYSLGMLPVFIAFGMLLKGILRKRPCKRR